MIHKPYSYLNPSIVANVANVKNNYPTFVDPNLLFFTGVLNNVRLFLSSAQMQKDYTKRAYEKQQPGKDVTLLRGVTPADTNALLAQQILV